MHELLQTKFIGRYDEKKLLTKEKNWKDKVVFPVFDEQNPILDIIGVIKLLSDVYL